MAKTLLFVSFLMSAPYLNAEQTFTPVEITSGFTQDIICKNKDILATNISRSSIKSFQRSDKCVFYIFDVETRSTLYDSDGTVAKVMY